MVSDQIEDVYGDVYGIKIYNMVDGKQNSLFKKKYRTKIGEKTIKETKLFYESLRENNTDNVYFKIYVEYENNYRFDTPYMIWLPIPLDVFLQKFV